MAVPYTPRPLPAPTGHVPLTPPNNIFTRHEGPGDAGWLNSHEGPEPKAMPRSMVSVPNTPPAMISPMAPTGQMPVTLPGLHDVPMPPPAVGLPAPSASAGSEPIELHGRAAGSDGRSTGSDIRADKNASHSPGL
jgi:hypothetical protein